MDFLAKLPSFSLLPPHFLGKRRTLLPAPAIRRFSQFIDTVCFAGEGLCLFLPSPVKERGVKPSHTSRCFIGSYRRMVKRWRQKTKNAGRARNARALGGSGGWGSWGGRRGGINDREAWPNSGEKGLLVVATSLQMSDEPIFYVLEFTGQPYSAI